MYFDLVNDGTAAATHVVVTLTIPAGLIALPAHVGSRSVVLAERPRPPAPPTPPRPDGRAPLNLRPAMQAETEPGAVARGRPQSATVLGPRVERAAPGDTSSLVRYDVSRVPHGDPVQLDAVEIRFSSTESAAAFPLEYVITADELEAPVRGRIAVSVVRRTEAVDPLDGAA